MARKTRQYRDRGIRLSEAQMRHPGMEGTVGRQPDEAPRASSSQTSDLAEEYRYVLADLRRIGVIAVAMLGALVALALLLP